MATLKKIAGDLSDEIPEALYRTTASLIQAGTNELIQARINKRETPDLVVGKTPPGPNIDNQQISRPLIPGLIGANFLSGFGLAFLAEISSGAMLRDPLRRVAYNFRVKAWEDVGVIAGKKLVHRMMSSIDEMMRRRDMLLEKQKEIITAAVEKELEKYMRSFEAREKEQYNKIIQALRENKGQGKRTRSATPGGAPARGRIPTATGESRASLVPSDT